MLYGILLTLFIILSILLVLIIIIQQGKSSMGFGGLGNSAQMLFGGSGGQDIFQKTTWILGSLFMIGSFALTLMKSRGDSTSRYFCKKPIVQQIPAIPTPPASAAEPSSSAPTSQTEAAQL